MFFQGTHLHVPAAFIAIGIPSVLSAIFLANWAENAMGDASFRSCNIGPLVSLSPLIPPLLHHFLLFPWIWLLVDAMLLLLLNQGMMKMMMMCISSELRWWWWWWCCCCCCCAIILSGSQFQIYFLNPCSHLSHCLHTRTKTHQPILLKSY